MLEYVILFMFVVSCVICSLKKKPEEAQQQNAVVNPPGQELGTVRQNMSERRRQSQAQSQVQQYPPGNPPVAAEPHPSAPPVSLDGEQQRKELIHSSLFHRSIDRPESVRSVENILKASQDRYEANTEGNSIARSYQAAASSVRTIGERECCICLDVYESGETISWAKSDKCDHIFHEECAIEWLTNHDDCPLCRTMILNA